MAKRQWGVVHRTQLEECGWTRAAISRALKSGRLHRIHPRVYAVGHRALSVGGELAAALFHAGPGAMLSHATAAWWWGLLPEAPRPIHLSAPGYRSSTHALRIHRPRHLERVFHRRLPVTPVPRTLLDLASSMPFFVLRRALAEAEYLRLVHLDDVEAALGRGQPGSNALRRALRMHRPELARTRSRLEERLLGLCECFGIPIPEVNVKVCGFEVDALWRELRLVAVAEAEARAAPDRADRGMQVERRRELAGFASERGARPKTPRCDGARRP